jgi:hypothetical protein
VQGEPGHHRDGTWCIPPLGNEKNATRYESGGVSKY